ncbi:MAG TPA: haloacid dehalogenase type II [Polyangiaceae bacterium]|nr:haloacid dehalogenase type II [Polyangiaceae bacterium]
MKHAPIEAFVFDAYGTLFDLRALTHACETLWSDKGAAVADLWRRKQLEYTWLRTIMGKYEPFSAVTAAALRFSAAANGVELSDDASAQLLGVYRVLPLYPEVRTTLFALKASGRKLAVLSNGSPDMLEPLVTHGGIAGELECVLSVDALAAFKPAPAVYHFASGSLAVDLSRIGFVSSNGWDIAGAHAAGLTCFWVNRAQLPAEGLGAEPKAVLQSLDELLRFAR